MTVTDLYPEFPEVRCAKCNLVYTLVTDTGHGTKLIVGECPRCHCEKFNTTLPEGIS